MKRSKLYIALILPVLLWGCGKGNPEAPATIDPVTGKHAVANWMSVHGSAGNNFASCQECHGEFVLQGGVFSNNSSGGISKVKCAHCHILAAPVDKNYVSIGCDSCHQNVPPNGNVDKNHEYGHKNHWNTGLKSVVSRGGCKACHNGLVKHGAVMLDARFSEGGNAVYNSATGTCANISCHGQAAFATQPWTDTIPVIDHTNPDPQVISDSCYNCHKISTVISSSIVGIPTPYIGPFSGRKPSGSAGENMHQNHVALKGALCKDCHNLDHHFEFIQEGRRLLQKGFALSSVGGPGTLITSYVPVTGSCSAPAVAPDFKCHFTIDPVKYTWY